MLQPCSGIRRKHHLHRKAHILPCELATRFACCDLSVGYAMLFSRRWMLCCRRRNIRAACLNCSDADAKQRPILLFIKLNFINTFEKEHNLFTFSAYYKQCQDEEHEPQEQTQRQTNNFFFFVIRRETELLPLLMRDGHPAGWPFFSCRIQTCGLSGILIHK